MPVHQRYTQFENDQRQFFDELITEDWNTYKSEEWDYTRAFEVKQLFKRIKPAAILDVGCGVGYHDVLMAEYSFVKQVDALDYSEQSILRANTEYPHPKVRRVVADFNSFDEKQPYDLVVSFQVFEHLTTPANLLTFCSRSCRKGGMVAIFTPNRLRFENRIRLYNNVPPVLIDVMHFREYTATEIFKMGTLFDLSPAGWFGHSLYINSPWFSKLSYRIRTQLGYVFPHFSHILCVLLRKV